ncbi:hypothetical protein GGF50DRAFT_100119 [Schizophyllum commune]
MVRTNSRNICHVSLLMPFTFFSSRNSNHHCVYSSFHPSSSLMSTSSSSSRRRTCDTAPPCTPWGMSSCQNAFAMSAARLRAPSARENSNVYAYTLLKYCGSDPSRSRNFISAACMAGSLSQPRRFHPSTHPVLAHEPSRGALSSYATARSTTSSGSTPRSEQSLIVPSGPISSPSGSLYCSNNSVILLVEAAGSFVRTVDANAWGSL